VSAARWPLRWPLPWPARWPGDAVMRREITRLLSRCWAHRGPVNGSRAKGSDPALRAPPAPRLRPARPSRGVAPPSPAGPCMVLEASRLVHASHLGRGCSRAASQAPPREGDGGCNSPRHAHTKPRIARPWRPQEPVATRSVTLTRGAQRTCRDRNPAIGALARHRLASRARR
jgi:hypothetical protein